MIPISVVDVQAAEPLVVEVLRSGRIAQGPMVERLETEFAAVAGTRHAVAVNSGTAALVAALQALGVGPGDEVLTTPFTFVATLNAILEAGATARFADIRPDDFALDPAAVAAAIGPRTRVLMPVHLFGQTADLPALLAIADRHGLAVVEDAAQAVGASCAGRMAGSFGLLGCFSLYATKNVTTAEGGVITTDDAALADRLRLLRNHGMRARYDYRLAGHNYRMSDLHAALGIPQLAALAERTDRRRRNAEALSKGLDGVPGLTLPRVADGREHVWHQYTVRVGQETGDPAAVRRVAAGREGAERDAVADALAVRGVGTGVYYPRVVFDYDCYRDHPRVIAAEVPVARRVAAQVLSLPVHPLLTDDELDTVVGAVREVVGA